jgi:formylglycine-generating enzyme required for sulfatase activity
MKKQYILAIIFLVAIAFFSFTKKGYDPLAITRIISENTFLDVAEVTNLNWREYISWNENRFGKGSKEYLASLPDIKVWAIEKFNPLREKYLNHPSYNDYPVVGVSYEQAVAYCNWRSARINEVIKIQNKKSSVTYSCRLPTKSEWEKLARIETYYFAPYKTENHNLQEVTDDGVVHENDITSPVKSFTPTLNGYYNLIGNVAEMVAEKGIAKGGSWQHTNIGLSHETDYKYTQPTNWIGFRCVLVRN